MPNRKPANSSDSARKKAAAMREAQRKADVRTRNIIIGVITVIVVAIVAAIVLVVVNQSKDGQQSTSQSGAITSGNVPAQFANGEPIVVSSEGVGAKNDGAEDLTIYFSYTCHWCTYLETNVGEMLASDAQAGDYNLVLQPVATVDMPWRGPATSAALWVAAEDPENFVAFHQALTSYFMEAYNASNTQVIGDQAASVSEIAKIAKENGVSDEVIGKFQDNADEYLEKTTQAWRDVDVTGRSEDGLGTPEIVFADTQITWSQGTPEEIYTTIIDAMKKLGYGTSTSQSK